MKTLLVLTFLLLAACGSGSGGSETEKPFKSLWTNKEDAEDQIDLSDVEFNQQYALIIPMSVNATCVCAVTAVGDSSQGLFSFSQCNYYGPGQSLCNMQYTALTYTKSMTELVVCDANPTCTTYK